MGAKKAKPVPSSPVKPDGGRSPRLVTFGVACSLDNFIARKEDGVDWLR